MQINYIFLRTFPWFNRLQFRRVSRETIFESGKTLDQMIWQWNICCASSITDEKKKKKRAEFRVNRARSELEFRTIDGDNVSFSVTARLSLKRGIFFSPLGAHSISSILLHAVKHAENGDVCTREVASGWIGRGTYHRSSRWISRNSIYLCSQSPRTRILRSEDTRS